MLGDLVVTFAAQFSNPAKIPEIARLVGRWGAKVYFQKSRAAISENDNWIALYRDAFLLAEE